MTIKILGFPYCFFFSLHRRAVKATKISRSYHLHILLICATYTHTFSDFIKRIFAHLKREKKAKLNFRRKKDRFMTLSLKIHGGCVR